MWTRSPSKVADHGARDGRRGRRARGVAPRRALVGAAAAALEIALAIAVAWGTALPAVDGFAPIGSASAGSAEAVLEHLVVAPRSHGDAPGVDGVVAAVSGSQLERPPAAPPAPAARVALLQGCGVSCEAAAAAARPREDRAAERRGDAGGERGGSTEQADGGGAGQRRRQVLSQVAASHG